MPTVLTKAEVLEKAQAIHDAEDGAPKRMAAAEFVEAVGGSYTLTSFMQAADTLGELGFGSEAGLVENMSLDCD